MARFESKYIVSAEELADLRGRIRPYVDVDPYAQLSSGEYTVHTIYFDTSALDYYHEKVSGDQRRLKIRIRGYGEQGDESPVFLEIKRKHGAIIAKSRAMVSFADAGTLIAHGDVERYVHSGTGGAETEANARRFLYHVYRYLLRPVVLTHYEREAYVGKSGPPVRITFDKNLRGAPFPRVDDLFGSDGLRESLSRRFILEVKFSYSIPWWLNGILVDFGLRRISVSKYTICLDSHDVPRRSSRHRTFFAAALPGPRGPVRGALSVEGL